MAEEKCFCHLNGYKVKDADARAGLELLETNHNNLASKVNGIDTAVRLLETNHNNLASQVNGIDTAVRLLETNHNNLEEGLQNVVDVSAERFDTYERDIAENKSSIEQINVNLGNSNNAISINLKNIQRLESAVGENMEAISTLQETVNNLPTATEGKKIYYVEIEGTAILVGVDGPQYFEAKYLTNIVFGDNNLYPITTFDELYTYFSVANARGIYYKPVIGQLGAGCLIKNIEITTYNGARALKVKVFDGSSFAEIIVTHITITSARYLEEF